MLAALDFSPVISGPRGPGDVVNFRPLFYGVLPPPEFLSKSVDYVRELDPEDMANSLLPVSWLAAPRDALLGEFSPQVKEILKNGLSRSLQCSMSPREQVQVWYCLRALGVLPPEEQAHRLLGVVFEFPQEKGLSILGVYSDKSSFAIWEGGGARWPAYEQGPPTIFGEDIFREAGFLGAQSGELGSDLPPVPPLGKILISYLYPKGIRYNVVPFSSILSAPEVGIYNSGVALFTYLFSGGRTDVDLPMDLEDTRWVFPKFSSRAGAFLADLIIYVGLLFGILYSVRAVIFKWDPLALGFLGFFIMLLPPFLAAWMESSSDWGFKTLGKNLFGLAVYSVSDSGGPTFLQALARNCSKWYLSPAFLFTGFLWAGFHRFGRAWHDILAQTVVLSAPDEEESEAEEG